MSDDEYVSRFTTMGFGFLFGILVTSFSFYVYHVYSMLYGNQ
jgi:hypothetical protein